MDYRNHVHRKIKAYHVQVQAGLVAQGLIQYLSVTEEQRVWQGFGSWLRTIQAHVALSERVVDMALRNALPEFLLAVMKSMPWRNSSPMVKILV